VSPFRKRSKISVVLELLLDASLLIIFVAQAFLLGCLLTFGYIPIPKDWASEQLAPFLAEGLRIEAETIRLRLNGDLELMNVAAWSDSTQRPILESDGAIIHLNFNRKKNYQPFVESLVISNGTLYLPAVYSPDGLRRPILEKIAFRLLPEEDLTRIDSFAALHEAIRLRGSIEWPHQPQLKEDQTDLNTLIGNFFKYTSSAIAQKDRFQIFETPTIEFHLTAEPETEAVNLLTRLSSRALNHPAATAENIQIDTELRIEDSQITTRSPLRIQARRLQSPKYSISSSGLDAIIAQDEWQALFKGQLPSLNVSAKELSIHKVELVAPLIEIHPKNYPEIEFEGATSGFKGAVTFQGNADLAKQRASVQAQGSVDLLSLLPEEAKTSLPKLNFARAPYYEVALELAEGYKIRAVELDVDSYEVSVANITFDHVDARATFKDDIYNLEHVRVRRGEQWVNVTLDLDTNTWDYKVSLFGTAIPYEYNEILPSWWAKIFTDFDFSEVTHSLGDFIIYGNGQSGVSELYFGHAQAQGVRYKDVLINQASAIVRGRGRYSEVTKIDAISDGGWAQGSIGFSSLDDDIESLLSLRLDFDAEIKLEDAKKLFGGNVAAILGDFKSSQNPRARLEGVFFSYAYPHYADSTYFKVNANSNGPISYKNVPLDTLKFELFGAQDTTYLRGVEFSYAEGKGSADIDIITPPDEIPQLRYEISLLDADQDQAIKRLPQLDRLKSELSSETVTPETNGNQEARVFASLHGQGPAQDPFRHSGYGNFLVKNKKLSSIQLLGPLSRLLQDTKLGFTSLNLETMVGSFELDQTTVKFTELQIDGPQTKIRAPGTISLKGQQLEMRVTVNLFANVGDAESPLRRVSDLITKPVPNFLVFDLSGTLQDQSWRSLYDPRNLIPKF
jgi:hypothetical protein